MSSPVVMHRGYVDWQIGREFLERQQAQGWCAKVIGKFVRDLRSVFPNMKCFSFRNLILMPAFAEACPEPEFAQQAVAQLPWFHLCKLYEEGKGNLL